MQLEGFGLRLRPLGPIWEDSHPSVRSPRVHPFIHVVEAGGVVCIGFDPRDEPLILLLFSLFSFFVQFRKPDFLGVRLMKRDFVVAELALQTLAEGEDLAKCVQQQDVPESRFTLNEIVRCDFEIIPVPHQLLKAFRLLLRQRRMLPLPFFDHLLNLVLRAVKLVGVIGYHHWLGEAAQAPEIANLSPPFLSSFAYLAVAMYAFLDVLGDLVVRRLGTFGERRRLRSGPTDHVFDLMLL